MIAAKYTNEKKVHYQKLDQFGAKKAICSCLLAQLAGTHSIVWLLSTNKFTNRLVGKTALRTALGKPKRPNEPFSKPPGREYLFSEYFSRYLSRHLACPSEKKIRCFGSSVFSNRASTWSAFSLACYSVCIFIAGPVYSQDDTQQHHPGAEASFWVSFYMTPWSMWNVLHVWKCTETISLECSCWASLRERVPTNSKLV